MPPRITRPPSGFASAPSATLRVALPSVTLADGVPNVPIPDELTNVCRYDPCVSLVSSSCVNPPARSSEKTMRPAFAPALAASATAIREAEVVARAYAAAGRGTSTTEAVEPIWRGRENATMPRSCRIWSPSRRAASSAAT